MNKKIVSPNDIKRAIFEEGLRIKRKKELHEEVKKIENELSEINEAAIGMAGSFGFVGDQSDNHKHGFVDDQFQNISNIARLEQEFSETEKPEALNEEIVEENEKLKAEIEKLKKQISESKSSESEKEEK